MVAITPCAISHLLDFIKATIGEGGFEKFIFTKVINIVSLEQSYHKGDHSYITNLEHHHTFP